MAEANRIEQIVEQAVSEVLEKHTVQLQRELVGRVLEQLRPQLAASPSGAGDGNPAGTAELLQAVQTIQNGTTQKEILRALLDSTDRYSGRAALFVVRGGAVTGWQGRGFQDDDRIKDFSLDVSSTGLSEVLRSRTSFAGSVAEMDQQFVNEFQGPAQDGILLLPLRLKDKLAAVVYADAGQDGLLDAASLELLLTATSAWLEVVSLRKHSHKEGSSDAPAERGDAAPVQTVSSFSDPFAGHAPSHTSAPAAQAAATAVAAAVSESAPIATEASAGAAAAPATDPFSQMSPEDADVHRKAQRFARLLVDEIKLYNQAKVAEGRKNKDLYDRLKEDIDKSRATYGKRYGNTVAAAAEYFTTELVRSLAEDDVSIMGAKFRR